MASSWSGVRSPCLAAFLTLFLTPFGISISSRAALTIGMERAGCILHQLHDLASESAGLGNVPGVSPGQVSPLLPRQSLELAGRPALGQPEQGQSGFLRRRRLSKAAEFDIGVVEPFVFAPDRETCSASDLGAVDDVLGPESTEPDRLLPLILLECGHYREIELESIGSGVSVDRLFEFRQQAFAERVRDILHVRDNFLLGSQLAGYR